LDTTAINVEILAVELEKITVGVSTSKDASVDPDIISTPCHPRTQTDPAIPLPFTLPFIDSVPFPKLLDDECHPKYFPRYGVTVAFLGELVNLCPGGRAALETEKTTTNDVCEKFIKPTTAPYKLSFCDLLRQLRHPAVSYANVFISHAWKYAFVDVVDALTLHFADALDTIVWFDCLSVNQHRSNEKDFTWWSSTFQDTIRQFGHTVMVLSPWQDPIPLTRAWCLWELYSTHVTRSKFEVALSKEEVNKFYADMFEDAIGNIDNMKSKIDVARSECYFASDKEKIFSAIQQKSSFAELNQVVFDKLRDFYQTRQ
jgi:hypothetical protein